MLTYEQMVERMAREIDPYAWDDDFAVFDFDAADTRRERSWQQARAALDASGLWPVYEAVHGAIEAIDAGDEMDARGTLSRALNAVETPNDPA